MLNSLGGWTVTLPGSGVDAHLVRARKQHDCSRNAHALRQDAAPCGRTIEPGQVYVKVRTAAWPNPDSPMATECAARFGWIER